MNHLVLVAIVICAILAHICERGSLWRVATGIWIAFCMGVLGGRFGGFFL